ncbi:MAG: hypothetical protein PHG44_07040 [Lentisphaeria bacterium]|jgi:hypothetical protein|nr:hypothetical protein [Lentisphaeria bacterium]MDY0176852.1 hypothetical protein [Lentisphaeria bacterium]NLZ59173.1 hypothetical protein [Lentisphaerota bacterium]
MNCEKFAQEYMLADAELSAEALAHAKACPECAKLLALDLMIGASLAVPSARLDRLVLASVKAARPAQSPGWQSRVRRVLYAVAAALLLLLAITALTNKPAPEIQVAQAGKKTDATVLAQSELAEADLEALWYLNMKETDAELEGLEEQLFLYATLP